MKQTFAAEGKELRRKAGGYAHAKQFKRLRKVVKRQRTILGVVIREVQRKLDYTRSGLRITALAAELGLSMTRVSQLIAKVEAARGCGG